MYIQLTASALSHSSASPINFSGRVDNVSLYVKPKMP